jgi:hypothetical protein
MSSVEEIAYSVKDESGYLSLIDAIRHELRSGTFSDSRNADLDLFLDGMHAWLTASRTVNAHIPDDFDWGFAAKLLLYGWSYE